MRKPKYEDGIKYEWVNGQWTYWCIYCQAYHPKGDLHREGDV